MKNTGDLNILFSYGRKIYTFLSENKITLDDLNKTVYENNNKELIFLNSSSENKYAVIIPIPIYNNKNPTRIIITNNIINENELKSHILPAGKNEIIEINGIEFEPSYNLIQNNKLGMKLNNINQEQNNYLNNYNVLTTYTSSIKNMKYLLPIDLNEYNDIILQNYFSFPTYIDKYEKDIKINIKKYLPKYSFFGAANNDLLNIFIYGIVKKSLKSGGYYFLNLTNFFPSNLRIITDQNDFYEYMNFLLIDIKKKINIYIKKYYGKDDIYECDPNSIDTNDLTILTRPISICKGKKSILNKIYRLEGTKLISGFYGPNSLYDAYFDFDDNGKILINDLLSYFNNTAKYLKKDMEYNI